MPVETAPGEDSRHMRRALELAARGWGRVSPNPLVGAVVVRDGEVVGEGWHGEYGGPHAEAEALRRAGDRARGATLYVSLEPCSHHGKTPPCTDAVLRAGVARLVYACADPNPKARGGGAVLRARGVEVVGGVEKAAARELNGPFFRAQDPEAPPRAWLELKLALTLDARVADLDGRSVWITGEEARAEVHRLRAGFDAVAVGIGTALADDPLLTVRGSVSPRRPPVRVVFDRGLRLPRDSKLLRTLDEAPLLVVHGVDAPSAAAAALRDAGAELMRAGSVAEALRALREREIHSVLCEGGALIAAALLAEGLVDRLTLIYAPLLLGEGGRSPFSLPGTRLEVAHRWRTLRQERFGPDTLISLAP